MEEEEEEEGGGVRRGGGGGGGGQPKLDVLQRSPKMCKEQLGSLADAAPMDV